MLKVLTQLNTSTTRATPHRAAGHDSPSKLACAPPSDFGASLWGCCRSPADAGGAASPVGTLTAGYLSQATGAHAARPVVLLHLESLEGVVVGDDRPGAPVQQEPAGCDRQAVRGAEQARQRFDLRTANMADDLEPCGNVAVEQRVIAGRPPWPVLRNTRSKGGQRTMRTSRQRGSAKCLQRSATSPLSGPARSTDGDIPGPLGAATSSIRC